MSLPQQFDLQTELAKCKTADDLTGKNGLIQRLIGGMLEQMLQKEMDEHLGYEKHSPEGHHSGNSRNGRTKKALKSNYGEIELEVPRDRNSIKYIPTKYSKEFISDLKAIYGATTLELAEQNLEMLQGRWNSNYPLAVKPWVVHWDNIRTFFEFSAPIRRIIYTTNAVESLHRQFRKVTKNKAVFPTDDALFKMLFLASRDISKKWTMPIREWKTVISQWLMETD
jgi:transposase-like protein